MNKETIEAMIERMEKAIEMAEQNNEEMRAALESYEARKEE